MVGTIVRIDGLPVAVGTANAFLTRLKPAFEKRFPGITLHVYSGYRSYEDQVKIFMDRYDPYPYPFMGPFNDVREWQGVRYVRMRGDGTVAQPGTSNHMSGHALDIRDSGSDPGVARADNLRSNWIRANALRYGFNPTGYGFREPWHIEYTGNPWAGTAPAPADTESEDDMFDDNDRKKMNAIYDALFKDGDKPKDWSMPHKVDWIRRQFAEPFVPADGGKQKWTLSHFFGWVQRTLNDVANRVKNLEGK